MCPHHVRSHVHTGRSARQADRGGPQESQGKAEEAGSGRKKQEY